MPYSFYLFLHVFSLMTVVVSLGILLGHTLQGGTKKNFKLRKPIAIINGVALVIAFVSGFGLMAKAGYSFSSSQWLYIKLICWVLVGVFPLLVYKKLLPGWMGLVTLLAIVGAAIYAVTIKPF